MWLVVGGRNEMWDEISDLLDFNYGAESFQSEITIALEEGVYMARGSSFQPGRFARLWRHCRHDCKDLFHCQCNLGIISINAATALVAEACTKVTDGHRCFDLLSSTLPWIHVSCGTVLVSFLFN